ncbi:hypothetical protein TNCV_4308921 [Trichonephila clavipes]|nr:hypothetical protein TNCV_4308921 [Trichonephila clavipes]
MDSFSQCLASHSHGTFPETCCFYASSCGIHSQGQMMPNSLLVNVPIEECMDLVDNYNQPCDSISYEATEEEVEITVIKQIRGLAGLQVFIIRNTALVPPDTKHGLLAVWLWC